MRTLILEKYIINRDKIESISTYIFDINSKQIDTNINILIRCISGQEYETELKLWCIKEKELAKEIEKELNTELLKLISGNFDIDLNNFLKEFETKMFEKYKEFNNKEKIQNMKDGDTIYIGENIQIHKYNYEYILYEIPLYEGKPQFIKIYKNIDVLIEEYENLT